MKKRNKEGTRKGEREKGKGKTVILEIDAWNNLSSYFIMEMCKYKDIFGKPGTGVHH